MTNLPIPAERLAAFVTYARHYAIEQAIIYAYGLLSGGRVERHDMLIADIRSVIGASPTGGQLGPGKPSTSLSERDR